MPPKPNDNWLTALVLAGVMAAFGTWLWDLQQTNKDFRERISTNEQWMRSASAQIDTLERQVRELEKHKLGR